MNSKFDEFFKLHHSSEPLLLGNAWNAESAKIFETNNYKAVGTSSAAVAESLGFNDGEEMTFEQYYFIISRIASSISVPFTVDLESGYGNSPEQIAANLIRLSEIGVVGVNLEDSVVANRKRNILPADQFAKSLRQLTSILEKEKCQIFINVRCDSFLLGLSNALEDALVRINAYQDSGVHGIFLPCIVNIRDIEKATQASKLPVNVMCIPGLPNLKELQQAGVRRISMGPFPKNHVYGTLQKLAETVKKDGVFDSLF